MISETILQTLKADGIDIATLKVSKKDCHLCYNKPYIVKEEQHSTTYVCTNLGCGFYTLQR